MAHRSLSASALSRRSSSKRRIIDSSSTSCLPSIVFEQAVVGAALDAYHYSYPPVLLLLITPLALMAHVPALLAPVRTSPKCH